MEETHKTSITKRTLLVYTAIFLAMIGAIYSYSAVTGSSFIWNSDGFTQHFQLFVDYVDKLRGFFTGEGFPLWDWTIGMGADTITSYGYYVIGDPFVYLGILFPPAYMELAYHLLIFVRIWFVGASFLLYARKMNVTHAGGLLGAVMYAFSHYVIYNVVRHPFFIMPMIWYPLLCLGVEKIFRKESGVLFAMMVALSAMVNFYFFYKLTLLVFLYGVVRYSSLFGFSDWKEAFRTLGRCVFLYGVGVLLSAVLFLPMVGGFLASSRSPEGAPINLLHYPLNYYFMLFVNALTPGTYLWTVGGFSMFALLAVVFLWRRRSETGVRFIWLAVSVMGVMILFPFFGSLMNGLSGPYNRFTFAFPFYFALAGAWLLEQRNRLEKRDFQIMRYALLFFTLFYTVLMFVDDMVLFYLNPLLIGWGMWSLLRWEKSGRFKVNWRKNIPVALIALTAGNLAVNALGFYYPFGKNAMAETLEYGESEAAYRELFGGLEQELPEDSLYRVGVTSKDNHVRNQFVYLDLMGLNSYLSLTDGDVAQFAYDLESGAFQVIQPLRNGVDDRRILNHLLGVRYILTEEQNERYLPFGYDVIHRAESGPGYIIAETDYAYPFAYAEDTWLPYTDFSDLNPVEKEAFFQEGAVLEDGLEVPGMQVFEEELPVETVPIELEPVESGFQQTGEAAYHVPAAEGQVTVTFDNPEDIVGKEIYVHLQGLDYERLDPQPLVAQDTSYRMRVFFAGRQKSILQSNRYSFSSYFYRENMLFNMGYAEEAEESLTLQFDNAGNYKIEDIKVYALPADEERDRTVAAERRENALEIHTFEDQRIEGNIQRPEPGLLVTSIPYTTGWQAQVNGEPVETVRTNLGFIGLPLSAGELEVTFTYRTPWLTAGILISLFGAGLLVAYRYRFVRRKK